MARKYIDWTPQEAPGLVFWGETDRNTWDWCVYNPVDPLVNGQFEGAAGPPPAGWTETNCTSSRVAGSCRQDGLGYVGQILYNATATGSLNQAPLTIGNTYRVMGWARSDSTPVAVPRVSQGASVLWTGTASSLWQYFDVTFTATNATLYLEGTLLAAGEYVQFDNVFLFPLCITQLTDLSESANNLAQATTADRPAWIAVDESGVMRTDGVSDFVSKAFTLAQPCHLFVCCNLTYAAGDHCPIGGGTAGGGYVHWSGGSTTLNMNAGADVAALVGAVDGLPHVYDFVFEGATSGAAKDGGALSVCNPGAGALGGLSLGAKADASLFAAGDYCVAMAFSARQAEAQRQRIIRYCKRRAAEVEWAIA